MPSNTPAQTHHHPAAHLLVKNSSAIMASSSHYHPNNFIAHLHHHPPHHHQLTSPPSLIVPSNIGNIGLQNAINSAPSLLPPVTWVGLLGIYTDAYLAASSQIAASTSSSSKSAAHSVTTDQTASAAWKLSIQARLAADEYKCHPVFVADDEFDGHYNQFCKQVSLDESTLLLCQKITNTFLYFFVGLMETLSLPNARLPKGINVRRQGLETLCICQRKVCIGARCTLQTW
jgi:hypothetical protein